MSDAVVPLAPPRGGAEKTSIVPFEIGRNTKKRGKPLFFVVWIFTGKGVYPPVSEFIGKYPRATRFALVLGRLCLTKRDFILR